MTRDAVIFASAASRTSGDLHDDTGKKLLCACVGGLSLHAARRVEADDRAGLVRRNRYANPIEGCPAATPPRPRAIDCAPLPGDNPT